MIGMEGITPLFVATSAFAILLIVLTTVAATTIIVNRHRPTIAEAVQAERRRDLAQIDLEKVLEELRVAQASLTEADKKAAEVAWLEERLAALRTDLEQLEPRRKEVHELQSELEGVLTELGDARRELDEAEQELERAREAERQLDRLEAEIDVAEARRDKLELDIAGLEDQREEAVRLRAELRQIQDDTERERERQARITGQIAALEAHLETLESKQVQLDDLERKLADLSGELQTARHERDQAQSDKEKEADRKAELLGEIGALEARAKDIRDEIAGETPGAGADPLSDLRQSPGVVDGLRVSAYVEAGGQDGTEAAYLHRTRSAISAAELTFHERTINAFHTALKVGQEAPMTVLAGISGTGKTQLPRRYAEGMGIGFLPMPVQPRWDSPQDLLGFYNFIEKRYKATELSRAMYQMDGQGDEPELLQDRILLVLLDEMNLARVEYYFSEFLSRLELRPPARLSGDPRLRAASEIVIEVPGGHEVRIFPGHNVLFAGTMNEDESTQALSDKVLDRGNMLRFPAPRSVTETIPTGTEFRVAAPISFSRWRSWRREADNMERRDWARETVQLFSEHMKSMGRPFGHRVGQAIMAYAANYPDPNNQAGTRLEAALADQVEMRLLPKLRGIELEEHGDRLRVLAETVKDRLHDDSLSEAIETSIEASQETDRFAWRGVVR